MLHPSNENNKPKFIVLNVCWLSENIEMGIYPYLTTLKQTAKGCEQVHTQKCILTCSYAHNVYQRISFLF